VLLTAPTVVFGFAALDADLLPTWIQANATEPLGVPEAITPELLTILLSVW
jgi:hypothetical protein